jgi:hypothetical protein
VIVLTSVVILKKSVITSEYALASVKELAFFAYAQGIVGIGYVNFRDRLPNAMALNQPLL